VKRKLIKPLVISLIVSLVIGLTASFGFAAKKELTPFEFQRLTEKEKKEYKQLVLKIPHDLSGTIWRFPMQKGVWDSQLEAIIHSNLQQARAVMLLSLFEAAHPKVRIVVDCASYPDIATAIIGGEAPAYYGFSRDRIEDGIYADITDLVRDWDRAKSFSMSWWAEAWKNGRCYGVPLETFTFEGEAIECRTDWFKEAGIFNKFGEPLPEDNWTFSDFREIAKKLTDPKKNRWGFTCSPTIGFRSTVNLGYEIANAIPLYIPDKSGKYTWRFNPDPKYTKYLQLLADMNFKDKSILWSADKAFVPETEFRNSRAAMHQYDIRTHIVKGNRYSIKPTVPFKDLTGVALLPQGPYGLRSNKIMVHGLKGLNPTLSKEELEMALEWIDWVGWGAGRRFLIKTGWDIMEALGEKGFDPSIWMIRSFNILPEGTVPPDVFKLFEKMLFTPRDKRKLILSREMAQPPSLYEYDLDRIESKSYSDAMTALFTAVLSDPNCDYQAELNKAADFINKTCWNYKIKDDKEKFKRYYTALGDYYRKNYPEFYEKEWPKLLENYYKVW